ncbi:O-antigen ligase family protein [Vibrio sp. Isolate25]|uniref:O-antigen ligase family protein n=1 Tax=Vibrio sp. Isolate25 TaxID=2908535 RepID=UPI001EFD34C5|nr:O-antigen ligase family protein [Vibrio sp. Isolate25]MCG9597828.1 O-antigen ligase family protein [Vibrio sp. Isolate25]
MYIISAFLVFVLITADFFNSLYTSNILPLPSLGVLLFTTLSIPYIVLTGRLKFSINRGVFSAIILLILSFLVSVLAIDFNFVKLLHLFVYVFFMCCIYYLYDGNEIQFKLMLNRLAQVTSFIALFYVVLTLVANLNFDVDFINIIKTYPEYGLVRLAFIFNEPLSMGFYFILVYSIVDSTSKKKSYLFLLALGILFSFSLSSYLLFFLYLFLKNFRFSLFSPKFYFAILLMLALCFFAWFFLGDRVTRILMFEDGSTRIRIALTISALMMFFDNWLVGVGWGNSGALLDNYSNVFSSSVHMELSYSSNMYLSILSELGIVGSFPFFYLMIYLFRKSLHTREIFAGFVVVLVSFLQQSLLLTPFIWIYWVSILLIDKKRFPF